MAAASKPSMSAVGSASAYPELLGLLERLGEPGPGGVHLVEDEVGGAVDDAEHPRDPVARERLAQRPQDRDRARDGRLVEQVGPALPTASNGPRRPRRAAPCWPSRPRHRLPSAADPRPGPLVPRPPRQRRRRRRAERVPVVGGQQSVEILDVAGRVEPAHGDADQSTSAREPSGQVAPAPEQAHHLRADRPAAQHRHTEPPAIVHETSPTSVANRSSSVSRRTTTRATPSRTATTGGRRAWL